MTWLYNGEELTEVPKGSYGFVYKITNVLSGRMYIGRKYFWTVRKVKNKKRRVTAESKWKDYYGSSEELLTDVKSLGKQMFIREIQSIHETKGQCNYAEIKMQFQLDVLFASDSEGHRIFYNKNIMSRYFSPTDFDHEDLVPTIRELAETYSDEESIKVAKSFADIDRASLRIAHWTSLRQEERDQVTEVQRNMAKLSRAKGVSLILTLDTGEKVEYTDLQAFIDDVELQKSSALRSAISFDQDWWKENSTKYRNCVSITAKIK